MRRAAFSILLGLSCVGAGGCASEPIPPHRVSLRRADFYCQSYWQFKDVLLAGSSFVAEIQTDAAVPHVLASSDPAVLRVDSRTCTCFDYRRDRSFRHTMPGECPVDAFQCCGDAVVVAEAPGDATVELRSASGALLWSWAVRVRDAQRLDVVPREREVLWLRPSGSSGSVSVWDVFDDRGRSMAWGDGGLTWSIADESVAKFDEFSDMGWIVSLDRVGAGRTTLSASTGTASARWTVIVE